MRKLHFILLMMLALTLGSCNKSTEQLPDDPHTDEPGTDPAPDDGYGDKTLLSTHSFNGEIADLKPIRGIAADGASTIDLLVPVKKSNNDPIIDITAETEEWGEIKFIEKTEFSSPNHNFYRYRLTASEDLPEALISGSEAELNYKISVSDSEGNSMAAPVTISVIRPAVIFAHGLASSYDTYTPMLGYIHAMGLYKDEALYALDYAGTSTSSYSTNLNVVPEAIAKTKAELAALGYVNEKYTIVGHSMGGILTRLYIQNEATDYPYKDDILKIITIDTPHSGSQLADFALALGSSDGSSKLDIFKSMGAIVDLAVESEATKNLNDKIKLEAANALSIPTHIFSAHIGSTSDVIEMIKEKNYLFALISYLLNSVEQKLIYGDDKSDIVVPMKSQLGGVDDTWKSNFITTYTNEWHCSVHTTEQAAIDIVALFDTPSSDDKLFTTEGFAPEKLTYSANTAPEVTMISARPDLSTVATQLLVGLDKDNNIISAAYDDKGAENLTLEESNNLSQELYFVKLNSGEVKYMLTNQ